VLAVLLVASLWPVRFRDGWVTVDEFRRTGFYLRHRSDRESLKATIRAAVRDFGRLAEPVEVESERVDVWSEIEKKDMREDHRRLVGGIPLRLWVWFMGDGAQRLEPTIRHEFHESQLRPAVTFEEVLASLEDTVVRTYLAQGSFDQAVERARAAISQPLASRARRSVALALATSLLRRGRSSDLREAERLLEELHAVKIRPLDHSDILTEARLRISLGYCMFHMHIRGQEPATQHHRRLVARIRALLGEADALATEISLSDRGQVANIQGLLFKWEAQVESSEEDRAERYEQAERYLRQALALWRLANDPYGLGVSLYNLGELAFSKYRLHRGEGGEAQIREALLWYEASIGFTESTQVLSEWFLDYGKAAECLTLLIPFHAERGELATCTASLHKIRKYLSFRLRTPPESIQQRMFDRIGRLLEKVWSRYSPPLPRLTEMTDQ
jgi:tetratricopeptide (TPR) repeat protein